MNDVYILFILLHQHLFVSVIMILPTESLIFSMWPTFYIFFVTCNVNNIISNLTSKLAEDERGGLLTLDSNLHPMPGYHYLDLLSFASEAGNYTENFLRIYYENKDGICYIVCNDVSSNLYVEYILDTMVSLQSEGAMSFKGGWVVNSDGFKMWVIENIAEEGTKNIITTVYHQPPTLHNYPDTTMRMTERYLKPFTTIQRRLDGGGRQRR